MRYEVGGYQFQVGEVALETIEKELVRNNRGLRSMFRVKHNCTGQLLVDGSLATVAQQQNDLKERMFEMEQAFAADRVDAGMLHDDGTRSHFYFENGATESGTILTPPNFGGEAGVEYAALSSFSFSIEAYYLDPVAEAMSAFSETVSYKGTGGPRRVVVEMDTGPPRIQQVSTNSAITAVQSGTIVGLKGWIDPTPLSAIGTELVHERNISRGEPTRIGPGDGVTPDSGLIDFPTDYSFHFVLTSPPLSAVLPSKP